jgi:hypothetical protein
MKSKSLHGGGRRLSVRAVKAAVYAFIETKWRALTEGADGSGAGFSQEGMVELDFLHFYVTGVCACNVSESKRFYNSQFAMI